MVETTKVYKLPYIGVGDTLTPRIEQKRFVTIDKQLEALFRLFGNGVIAGWEIVEKDYITDNNINFRQLSSTSDVNPIYIMPGRGHVASLAAETNIATEINGLKTGTVENPILYYVYALARFNLNNENRPDTPVSKDVDFIVSTNAFSNRNDVVLLGTITRTNGENTIDISGRKNLTFTALLLASIIHYHRGGSDNPEKIDLQNEVKGFLSSDYIGDFDASKVTTGVFDEDLFSISHKALNDIGNLTHSDIDTLIGLLQKQNTKLFGDLTSTNLLQILISVRRLYSNVERWMRNTIVLLMGVSPHDRPETYDGGFGPAPYPDGDGPSIIDEAHTNHDILDFNNDRIKGINATVSSVFTWALDNAVEFMLGEYNPDFIEILSEYGYEYGYGYGYSSQGLDFFDVFGVPGMYITVNGVTYPIGYPLIDDWGGYAYGYGYEYVGGGIFSLPNVTLKRGASSATLFEKSSSTSKVKLLSYTANSNQDPTSWFTNGAIGNNTGYSGYVIKNTGFDISTIKSRIKYFLDNTDIDSKSSSEINSILATYAANDIYSFLEQISSSETLKNTLLKYNFPDFSAETLPIDYNSFMPKSANFEFIIETLYYKLLVWGLRRIRGMNALNGLHEDYAYIQDVLDVQIFTNEKTGNFPVVIYPIFNRTNTRLGADFRLYTAFNYFLKKLSNWIWNVGFSDAQLTYQNELIIPGKWNWALFSFSSDITDTNFDNDYNYITYLKNPNSLSCYLGNNDITGNNTDVRFGKTFFNNQLFSYDPVNNWTKITSTENIVYTISDLQNIGIYENIDEFDWKRVGFFVLYGNYSGSDLDKNFTDSLFVTSTQDGVSKSSYYSRETSLLSNAERKFGNSSYPNDIAGPVSFYTSGVKITAGGEGVFSQNDYDNRIRKLRFTIPEVVSWNTMSWMATEPYGSKVVIRVKTANTEEGETLDTQSFSNNIFCNYSGALDLAQSFSEPTNIVLFNARPSGSSLSLPDGNQLELEVTLQTSTDNLQAPILNAIYITFTSETGDGTFVVNSEEAWGRGRSFQNVKAYNTDLIIKEYSIINRKFVGASNQLLKIDRSGNNYNFVNCSANNLPLSVPEMLQKAATNENIVSEYRDVNSVFTDVDNSVWLADTGNNRILQLDKDGNFLYGLYGLVAYDIGNTDVTTYKILSPTYLNYQYKRLYIVFSHKIADKVSKDNIVFIINGSTNYDGAVVLSDDDTLYTIGGTGYLCCIRVDFLKSDGELSRTWQILTAALAEGGNLTIRILVTINNIDYSLSSSIISRNVEFRRLYQPIDVRIVYDTINNNEKQILMAFAKNSKKEYSGIPTFDISDYTGPSIVKVKNDDVKTTVDAVETITVVGENITIKFDPYKLGSVYEFFTETGDSSNQYVIFRNWLIAIPINGADGKEIGIGVYLLQKENVGGWENQGVWRFTRESELGSLYLNSLEYPTSAYYYEGKYYISTSEDKTIGAVNRIYELNEDRSGRIVYDSSNINDISFNISRPNRIIVKYDKLTVTS